MKDKEFHKMLDKYLSDTVDAEEKAFLEAYYAKLSEKSEGIASWPSAELSESRVKMKAHIQMYVAKARKQRVRSRFLAIAASIALILGACTWYLLSGDALSPDVEPETVADVITKSTLRGQKLTVRLPDGSVVKLNSESSISYPSPFSGDARSLDLKGEAFFTVAHNAKKPFIVNAGNLETTVLGTSFNIAAFSEDDEIKVTVATGKVLVQPKEESNADKSTLKEEVYLIPGQQAIYEKRNESIVTTEVPLEKHLAWKNNQIIFEDVPFSKAMKVLERWFDVEIKYEDIDSAGDCYVSGKFDNETLKNILDGLKFLKGFEHEFITSKEILITGRPCN